MEDNLLERINYLAHKAKNGSLTTEEIAERHELRRQYLKRFRESMSGMMDNVYIKEADGTEYKLKKKSESMDGKQ